MGNRIQNCTEEKCKKKPSTLSCFTVYLYGCWFQRKKQISFLINVCPASFVPLVSKQPEGSGWGNAPLTVMRYRDVTNKAVIYSSANAGLSHLEWAMNPLYSARCGGSSRRLRRLTNPFSSSFREISSLTHSAQLISVELMRNPIINQTSGRTGQQQQPRLTIPSLWKTNAGTSLNLRKL